MADAMVTWGAAVLLVATMLTAGTRLTGQGFASLRRRPRPVLAAMIVNVAVVPGIATVATTVAPMGNGVAVGIVLAAAAPGGGSGVLLAEHARGDAVVAVTLQALLAPLGALAIPVWLSVAAVGRTPEVLELLGHVAPLLVAQVAALLAGAWLAARWPVLVTTIRRGVRRGADLLLVALTTAIVLTSARELPSIPTGAYAVMALVVTCSLATHVVPGLGPAPVRRSVTTVTAVRNLALAIAAAGLLGGDGTTALTIVAYGLVMYLLVSSALVPRVPAGPRLGGNVTRRRHG